MNIGIVGLGLIGGSLGRAIVSKTENTVFAYDIDKHALSGGKLLNAFHQPLTEENVGELDVLFFTLYPNALEKALAEYCPKLKKGCIVADCCGNKRRVVAQMEELSVKYPDLQFISTHPMAGREFSGIKHSTVNMFDKASMILVPVNTGIKEVSDFKNFVLSLGFGSVVITTAARHDEIIAYTSQLAHLVSSSYIKSKTAESYLGFSAGSFRDMTRVARLSPEMWSQLMEDNADNLVTELDSIIKSLEEYKSALSDGDIVRLKNLLADGNERKLTAEKMRREQLK